MSIQILPLWDTVARSLAGWALKVPPKNALTYNFADSATFYVISIGLYLLGARSGRIDSPTETAKKEKFALIYKSFLVGRVMGLAVGFFAARVAGHPVRAFDAVAMTLASTAGMVGYLFTASTPPRAGN